MLAFFCSMMHGAWFKVTHLYVCVVLCRALIMDGTLLDVNVFHVSASDLLIVTDIILKLPTYEAAVNSSIAHNKSLPTTSVIINVLYDVDYTGHGSDPNGTLDSSRTPAVTISLDGFGMSGLFAVTVRTRCVMST